jgi:hypothetical protein
MMKRLRLTYCFEYCPTCCLGNYQGHCDQEQANLESRDNLLEVVCGFVERSENIYHGTD